MSGSRVSSSARVELTGFEVVSTEALRFACPEEVDWSRARKVEQALPVAALLARAGELDLERPPPLDACDHWYRAELPAPTEGASTTRVLVFDGLATLVDVWLDGRPSLTSDNMFARHELTLGSDARELVLRFRALDGELAKRRPRPRWRTRLVEQQQLRFLRTSLLGRTPGICPRVPIVGPYRPIAIETRGVGRLEQVRLETRIVSAPHETLRGEIYVRATVALGRVGTPEHAELWIEGEAGSARAPLASERRGDQLLLTATAVVQDAARWWPHTHGAQPRSRATIRFSSGFALELGSIAFRELAADAGADGAGFGLTVHGVPLFARGACWITDDLLASRRDTLRDTLELVKRAGMNMLRVTGTSNYESDGFYELCDELGILVFQDFMFANMDYPADDPAFVAAVEAEVRTLLARIGSRPCLAVLCGGSEVQQQAAMLGLPRELWSNSLFDELLPRLCRELAPGVPYVPSSPSGGALPFHADSGVTHYYGVGAYLRPPEDARRANVRFAAECLAFSNVPCNDTIEQFLGELEAPFHHPRWKQRVPRDRGASWDFEDVRDHYLQSAFGVDARLLRTTDMQRYLALGHAAVGELMQATFHEWRRPGSSCRGALVYWLKDIWDGACFGVLDARGRPKPVYYYLKRSLQPISLALTDEGSNGLSIHLCNDTARSLSAELEIVCLRDGETSTAQVQRELSLAPHSARSERADALLERFTDITYAYRFGPPAHHVTVVRLRVAGLLVAEACHFPQGLALPVESGLGLVAQRETRGGREGVMLSTQRFAQCVMFDVPGFIADDDYFHLTPGQPRWIELTRAEGTKGELRGSVQALNGRAHVAITKETESR